ncbi:MAG TPA: alkaline phosphatase family protein, partial [Chthoniobacterales bacterium]|nr:alkaline phosphatase family protein [Chthoniobacterales bacterium]
MTGARLLLLSGCLFSALAFGQTEAAPGERHVVVVVWDGMRPDFVTERYAPTLWKLAQEGVTFAHHHSVYVSATNVNGAAIATGVYPNRNSLLANREFRPSIDPLRPFENAEPDVFEKADKVT